MKNYHFLISFLMLWVCVGFTSQRAGAKDKLSNDHFSLGFSRKGMASLIRSGDPEKVEFIDPGGVLGTAEIKYRLQSKDVRIVTNNDFDYHPLRTNELSSFDSQTVHQNSLKITSQFSLEGAGLQWHLEFENVSDFPIEVLDVAIPLAMNTKFP